jgi:hypothetical protein
MCSAIAATGVPALVMAKGHQIDTIKEVPFVVADKLQAFQKTKEAVCFLRMSRAWADVAKVSVSCSYIYYTYISTIHQQIPYISCVAFRNQFF